MVPKYTAFMVPKYPSLIRVKDIYIIRTRLFLIFVGWRRRGGGGGEGGAYSFSPK